MQDAKESIFFSEILLNVFVLCESKSPKTFALYHKTNNNNYI